MSAPSVHVCTCDGQFSYLVVNSEVTSNCYVYTIDKKTGGMYYAGVPDVDLFLDSKSAIINITDSVSNAQWQYLGKYLIGATIFDHQLIIMYVISDEVTAIYDNKHIKMIKSSDYYKIPLIDQTIEGDQTIFDFPMNENHFFSNYVDLSLPFPYFDVKKSTDEFFWNNRFTKIFEILHTTAVCIRVFQGGAFSLHKDTNTNSNITYIIKRSSHNSGTRYEARGLDKNHDPANECECSLIFTINGDNFGHTWRRGSAPIEWKTVLQSTFLAPQHIVKENPDEFTPEYFSKIIKRFDMEKVNIISLLNEAQEKGEVDLLQAYIKAVDRANKVLNSKISFNQIDINQIIANNKSKGRLVIFNILATVVNEIEFTSNFENQKKYSRFNCADSLDRTNLVSFYYAILVTYNFGLQHNIFVKEGDKSDDLTENINQDVLDFLCNAFISTGNIISLMYTNTPAIKTEAIRALMTEQTAVSPDVYITCLRRFHNVASDPYRHKMFKIWNQPENVDGQFYLDSRHLSAAIVPSKELKIALNSSIFEEEIKYFAINDITNQNLYVALPEPLLLSTISILVPPRTSTKSATFSICCGNLITQMYPLVVDISLPLLQESQWCVYNFHELVGQTTTLPISIKSLEPCNFINIRFNSMDSNLIIGNIKIAVQRPRKSMIAARSSDTNTSLGAGVAELTKNMTMPSLSDLTKLDRWILEKKVSIITRNESLVRNNQNPYFFDIPSRLSDTREGECSFCHYRLTNSIKFGAFQPFLNYFRRFSETEKPDISVHLCPSCADQMETNGLPYYDESLLTNLTIADLYAERSTAIIDSYQPIFNIGLQSSIFYSSPPSDFKELNEILNPTIAFKGWHTSKKNVQLVIAFQSSAEVSQILVLLGKDCLVGDFRVYTENFMELNVKEIKKIGNQAIYTFSDSDPTRCIIIILDSTSDIVIKNIQIRGTMKKMKKDKEKMISPEKVNSYKFKPADGIFDFLTHSQTFKFSQPRKVQSITFKTDDFQSIYIVFILNGKIYDWQQLLLPKISQGSYLRYTFEDISGNFDEIKLFYLDKKPMSVPLDVSFN